MTPSSHNLTRVVDPQPIVRQVARELFGQLPGRTLLDGGKPIGTFYQGIEADYCFLEQLTPRDLGSSREEQTLSVFETIEHVLGSEGMGFGNVVRTWLYMDNILDWYDEFNSVRTGFFRERAAGFMPASTGIGMPNGFGATIIAGALAIRPKSATSIQAVPSPLQGSAFAYKSAFSRAVEVGHSDRRELYISGTASIEPGGKTAHVGDVRAQMRLTIEVLEALLHSRQMDWRHCTRAIAYFTQAQDIALLAECLQERGIQELPFSCMLGDICRGDLLFEMELDAVARGGS